MKRMIQGLVLVASLVVGGAAIAQSNMQGGTQGPMMGGKTTPKGMVEHMGFMVPADPKALLERLHHVNQHEIQLGRLAQQNGMSQDVKSYGEMLVRDHTAADERLMSYAQQKGFRLSEPKPMNDVERKAMDAERASMEKLRVLKAQPFDSSFLASMVGGHDMVLGKLMAAQQNVTDAGMTPMLQQLTQTITQHRQQAYTLLGRIGPGSSAGVGGAGDMGQGVQPGMGTGGAGDTGKGTKSPSDKNTMDPGQQKKF
jgi:putative membrane protein